MIIRNMKNALLRRRLLASVVAGVSITSLSGCSAFDSEPSPLPVEITNFTSERQYLDIEIIRRDSEDRSNATVLRESYELEPSDVDGENYTVPDMPTVPNRRYLVQARIGGTQIPAQHYHYIPDCKTSENHEDRLYIGVQSTENRVTIRFDQNGCQ